MIELTKGERAEWRQFITNGAGNKIMMLLEQMKPGIAESPEPHNFAFRAGIEQGYNRCLSELRDIAFFKEETLVDETPGLEPTRRR